MDTDPWSYGVGSIVRKTGNSNYHLGFQMTDEEFGKEGGSLVTALGLVKALVAGLKLHHLSRIKEPEADFVLPSRPRSEDPMGTRRPPVGTVEPVGSQTRGTSEPHC